MATYTIEIEQTGGYDETLAKARTEFVKRYPERGEPKDVQFSYAYPARMGESRTVGMTVTC